MTTQSEKAIKGDMPNITFTKTEESFIYDMYLDTHSENLTEFKGVKTKDEIIYEIQTQICMI